MSRIKIYLLFAIVLMFVPRLNGQTAPGMPVWIQGIWEGGCSWEHDTTIYPVRFEITSLRNYRMSIMDGKVNLGLAIVSSSSNTLQFFVDPRISDSNPIFAGAHINVTRVSQYISDMNYIVVRFDGSDDAWAGMLFKIK